MTQKSGFRVLHWNIRGAINNRDTLILLVRDYDPDIICLNETFLSVNKHFHIKKYNIIRDDRDDGRGGIAILIKKGIQCNIIHTDFINRPNHCQFMALELDGLGLVAMYNPPDITLSIETLQRIVDIFNNTFLLVGDLNAQNMAWGSSSNNRNGNIFEGFLESSGLVLLNDGSPTRLVNPGQGVSAPDLAVCGLGGSSLIQWEVIEENGMSDHFPFICSFNTSIIPNQEIESQNDKPFNIKKADWDKYKDVLILEMMRNPPISYKNFEEQIISAAEQSIPKKKNNNKVGHPWWDPECSEMIRRKRDIFKIFKSTPSIENYMEVRKLRAQCRKLLRSKRKKGFNNFCENLNPNTPATKIWRSFRRFSGAISARSHIWPLNNTIAKDLLDSLTSPIIPLVDLQAFNIDNNQSPPILRQELLAVITTKKDTCPGIDNIFFSMIKKLPEVGFSYLLSLYNDILAGKTRVPKEWKRFVIIPIHKRGKDPTKYSSYRPISLAVCICKLFESIIKNRVEWILENQKILYDLQSGFRRGKSILNNLTMITSEIYSAFSAKKSVLLITLDMCSAYDNVDINLLINKMSNLDLPGNICKVVSDLLYDRHIYVKDPCLNKLIGPKITGAGVTQGSPLSPCLFNIYVNSMREIIPQDIALYQYADDVALLCTGVNIPDMIRKINRVLEELNHWLDNHGISLSTSKSTAIIFTKNRNQVRPDNVLFRDELIPWKSEIKYLGVILDSKMTWIPHINSLKAKALQSINMLRYLCGTWWGAHPSTMLNFYKAYVRSHLEFGSILIGGCTRKSLEILDKVQFMALRLCLGMMKSTPTNILLSEAGETDLISRRNWLAVKFLLKQFSLEGNKVYNMVTKLYVLYNENLGYWGRYAVPPLLEAFDFLADYTALINKSNILPCFRFPLQTQFAQIPVKDFGLQKNEVTNRLFLNKLQEKTDYGTEFFYTDASKLENGSTGLGVWSKERNVEVVERLPNGMSICSAEIQAINRACDIVEELGVIRAGILTDSKSAIDRISNTSIKSDNDELTLKVKEKFIKFNQKVSIFGRHHLWIAWIPGHNDISGNVKADTLARSGTRHTEIFKNMNYQEFIPIIKKKMWEAWAERWRIISQSKGVMYADMTQKPLKKPWFKDLNDLGRKEITTFCRLRSNHCLSPIHMNRINVAPSPNCACGELGDIHHILFNCRQYAAQTNQLYLSLTVIFQNSPISLSDILHNHLTISCIKLVVAFLNACDRKL